MWQFLLLRGRGLATLLLSLYVMEEVGRKYVRDMPWPPAAECNMITNKQTNPRKCEITDHVLILVRVWAGLGLGDSRITYIDNHAVRFNPLTSGTYDTPKTIIDISTFNAKVLWQSEVMIRFRNSLSRCWWSQDFSGMSNRLEFTVDNFVVQEILIRR